MTTQKQDKNCVVIKKYANRRLYNTDTSAYITNAEIYELIQNEINFKIIDAKTDEDLTKNVLIQIIFEKESQNFDLLPKEFLLQILKYYEQNSVVKILPQYLTQMMTLFADNQQMFLQDQGQYFSNFFEDIAKKNLNLYQQSLEMFLGQKKK